MILIHLNSQSIFRLYSYDDNHIKLDIVHLKRNRFLILSVCIYLLSCQTEIFFIQDIYNIVTTIGLTFFIKNIRNSEKNMRTRKTIARMANDSGTKEHIC